MQRYLERAVIGFLFATCIIRVALIWTNWGFEDVDAYWDAAMRLREGQPLYPVGMDPDNYRVFRYAPWFAAAWVPVTFLPKALAELLWGAALAVAAASILIGLARVRSPAAWALALVMTPWLLSLVQVGNIQPLVVAMLAYGVSRRSGPLWVGIAASLKAVPLLWALVFLARRQWRRAILAGLIAAVLVAPILLGDLSGYMTTPGRSFSLYYYVSPLAWLIGAVAATAVAGWLAWRRSEYLWVAIAVAVMLGAPRSHETYATFLAVGLLSGAADRIRQPDA